MEFSSGFICDQNNQPIPYVFIYNKTKDNFIVSDENGVCLFPASYQCGDSLLFTRIGYYKQEIVLGNSPEPLKIILPFSPVNLDSITVDGQISPRQFSGINFSRVERTEDLGTVEHRRLWTTIPGLYLKSYGGPTGISTLSLDGSPSTHTKVIIAGFDLTSAQNGQMDISQLPPTFIAGISYSPDYAGNNSAENSEGLLNIEPNMSPTGFTCSAGSYGKLNLSANLDIRKTLWNSNVLLGHNYYRGDYKVTWRDQNFKRTNNSLQQNYFSWQSSYIFQSKAFARLIAFYSEQERGVAGLVWNPSPNAFRQDALGFIGLKIGWTGTRSFSRIQMLHRRSNEKYVNPQIAINSRHIVTTDQFIYNTNQSILNFNLEFTSDLKFDRLQSKQAGHHSRTTLANILALPWNFSPNYELRPWIKFEYSPDLYQKATWGGRIAFRGSRLLNSFSGSYGQYYAYPTFNDLYWQPGGNPNLKPDETTKYEIDIALQIRPELNIVLNSYYKQDKNLIQWTPVQSYWQPSNIAKAERKGAKAILNWSLPNLPIDGFLQGVVTHSCNLTKGDNYQKPLRYTPKESYAAGLNFNFKHIAFHSTIEYVGARIAMYNWPEDIMLSEYFIINTNLSYKIENRLGHFTLVCGIDNLTDESFESMQGYPEPGRAFTGTIGYNIK
ncbi:MAG TPA: TonB-dependent receptor [Candidatus Marinimicrobia bacterium]|nr:TonB-dependent receptor [Candidatus Neomarinimicrobiota bacterium]HRS52496.1 TonB-dependent receptor [Candidatus Neomarinimicrobiota bacterium]HRU93107.1 TonB-dependent receptor [Candidatus Neomarinimicrobiota bacterium]